MIKSSRKFKVFRYSQKSLKISPSTLFSIPSPCVCGPVLARQSKTNLNYSFTKTAKIQTCLFPLAVLVHRSYCEVVKQLQKYFNVIYSLGWHGTNVPKVLLLMSGRNCVFTSKYMIHTQQYIMCRENLLLLCTCYLYIYVLTTIRVFNLHTIVYYTLCVI